MLRETWKEWERHGRQSKRHRKLETVDRECGKRKVRKEKKK